MSSRGIHGIDLLLALAALILGQCALAEPGHPRNEVAFYIDAYGLVPPEHDPQVALAHKVFAHVRAVADKNSKRLPALAVVNSPGDPWAIALPSGHVVLSRQAVSICHQWSTAPEIEACLAFVLGHELAHLANDDFWHHEVYSFLAAHSDSRPVARLLQPQTAIKVREFAADDKGFIYAAMAGYQVGLLLAAPVGRPSFFDHWMQQTNTRVQNHYPNPADRAAVVRGRLQEIQDKLSFFDFGVRLSHFDGCEEAVYFLHEFQKVFPGREVLNNIGYCYLQLAVREMDPQTAYFYWMPLLLDGETRADGLTRGGVDMPHGPPKRLTPVRGGEAQHLLHKAVEHLEEAIKADPAYVPARVNLAVAYLYLGRPHHARSILVEARELAPADANVLGLEAVALYEQSERGLDLWSAAVARLEKLAAGPQAPAALAFNLARLLESGPRPAEARQVWRRLAAGADQLPDPIRHVVCRQHGATPSQACGRAAAASSKSPPWRWPLPEAGFARLAPSARHQPLAGWKAIPFDWFQDRLHGHIYRHPGGRGEVLEIDGFVQMQVLKGNPSSSVRELPAYCPRPLRQRPVGQGVVWSCDYWAALARDDTVQEAWLMVR